jgi:hypothetical protein
LAFVVVREEEVMLLPEPVAPAVASTRVPVVLTLEVPKVIFKPLVGGLGVEPSRASLWTAAFLDRSVIGCIHEDVSKSKASGDNDEVDRAMFREHQAVGFQYCPVKRRPIVESLFFHTLTVPVEASVEKVRRRHLNKGDPLCPGRQRFLEIRAIGVTDASTKAGKQKH